MFVIFLFCVLYAVNAKPLDNIHNVISAENIVSLLNPEISFHNTASNVRAKRSITAECEKLQLCRLHARSAHSFIAAFQLYFVNKENARLWDHRQRSMSECYEKFRYCYDSSPFGR